ncbi:autotransporter domain-containing protein [Alkalilimnicola sp. S0819]|uniref:autotransporter outer membrane beta-barrel domain-containing protein n=1 Tax=Alkalilimnicola sp. S0819 TaxID=2613922 RepID=UPI0012628E41|nr:autotransporter domain-containing protein [Alkalilimnicola sp. S0819]KAB7623992.1 autotransporter domain-containing protein [Alkalilimnicola sp. S0819]MPQ16596.1 autotransporter domain-containing protein [Alkalilimnicola sp. S0819]
MVRNFPLNWHMGTDTKRRHGRPAPRATTWLMLGGLLSTTVVAVADEAVWTGGGMSANWSDFGNYQGGSRIRNGEDLRFLGPGNASSHNDLLFLAPRDLRFDAAAPSFTLTGEAFSLEGSIYNDTNKLQTIDTSHIELRRNATKTISNAAGGTLTFTDNGAELRSPGEMTVTFTGAGTTNMNRRFYNNLGRRLDIVNAGGTLNLNHDANGYTSLTINAGTVNTGVSGALDGSAALRIDSGGTLNLQGHDQTVGSLNGDGNISLGAAILTVDESASSLFDGVISGTGALVKVGSGSHTLRGHNIYSGGTTVGAGTLIGDTDSLQGDISNNATLVFDQAADGSYGDVISGTGALTKRGVGSVTLTGANSYTGGTIITAGTLIGDTDSLQGDITNNAILVFDQAADGSYAGSLSGTGEMLKRGAGTVTLSSAGGHAGNTTVNGGTLVFGGDALQLGALDLAGGDLQLSPGDGNAEAGAVSIANGSTLGIGAGDWARIDSLAGAGTVLLADEDTLLSVVGAADTTFTGTINGDGGLSMTGGGTLTLQGRNHLLGGVLSVCGCSGDPAGLLIDGGTLTAGSGTGVANGLLQLSNNAQLITGDLEVSPLGRLVVEAGAELSIAGLGLINDQGVLVANGTVGNLLVDEGGTVMGGGTVRGLVALQGATLAPGNSIGALTVDGDLILNAGSRYEVEVDPAGSASDRIHVTGDAMLAGGVLHIGENGAYRAQSDYTILTADGSINGGFDSVSSAFAFLDPSLGYSAHAVTLTLARNDTDFADAARTRNQRRAANGVQSVGGGDAYSTVLGLSDPQAPGAFDALSGEAHASNQGALQQQTRGLPRRGLAALRGNLAAGLRPGAPTASAGDFVPAAALPRSAAYPLWLEARGERARLEGDGNAARLEQRSHGLRLGGDLPVGDWRLGGAFGYADQDLRVQNRAAEAEADSYQLAAYAGRAFALGKGRAHLIGGASWAHHEIDSKRRVVFPGFNETLRADYRAETRQLFAEAGYTLPLTTALGLTPYLALDWSEQRHEAFQEKGGGAALRAERGRNQVSTATLGLRASQQWEWRNQEGVLQADLGWRHAEGDLAAESEHRYAGGQRFTVSGAPIARDAAVLGLGLNMVLSDAAALGLRYDGQYGAGDREHSAQVSLRWRF